MNNLPAKTNPEKYCFYCRKCFVLWGHDNRSVEPAEACECPECGAETSATPELRWMRGLCKAQHTELTDEAREKQRIGGAQAAHPGPKTPLTKFRCSANGLKHGAYAKKHLLPLAKPGRLHDCQSCEFAPAAIEIDDERIHVNEHGNGLCQSQRWLYCVRHTEVIVSQLNAIGGGGPQEIADIIGAAQGLALVNLISALRQVSVDGPTVTQKITRPDKDGNPVDCGERIDPHPALVAIRTHADVIGVDLNSWNLTPKSQVEKTTQESVSESLARLFNHNTDDERRRLAEEATVLPG